MTKESILSAGLRAGGAPVMWERVLRDALPAMRNLVPAGSRVLEIGYGDGLLTGFLCAELGWFVTGLEVSEDAHHASCRNAKECGFDQQVNLLCCSPAEIRQHTGQYDAVFIKTVLYNSSSLDEYGRWLDWILSVLRPGAALINFESCRANRLTQIYRKLRRRIYTDLCLYNGEVETLYDSRFEIIERQYYGGLSQFLAPIPPLYFIASGLEESIRPRHADNCFIVSIIGIKH